MGTVEADLREEEVGVEWKGIEGALVGYIEAERGRRVEEEDEGNMDILEKLMEKI